MNGTTSTSPTIRLTSRRVHEIEAGVPHRGDFECMSCGYGVSVWHALPRCPMCGAAEWTAAGRRTRTYA